MALVENVCELNKQTGEIFFNGKAIQLRPKTFELLVLLASNPDTIHSKSEILASVWQNSVVEDQVIFQSINEIRKEIGLTEAIKTYPRRGYKLALPVNIIDDNSAEPVSSEATLNNQTRYRLPAVALSILVFAASIFYLVARVADSIPAQTGIVGSPTIENAASIHRGILVLPFNVSSLHESRQWLRYGGMEALIRKIAPNDNTTVFHVEDAIEILNRIAIDERDDVNKIFDKSGAYYILQTTLSGQPGEINVVYNIYTRESRTTRTVQATNLETLLSALKSLFEEEVGEVFESEDNAYDQQLQNKLIAKAMYFLELDDLNSALSFVKSAVINDPNNMLAAYLFVKINMESNQINEGMIAVEDALLNVNNASFGEYEHRLLYFKGVGLAASGMIDQAQDTLLASKELSQKRKDWLYFAYNQSVLGKLLLIQKQHQKAYSHFQSALAYQQLLNCPVGIAQGYLDFTDYYLDTGDMVLAQQHYDKAQSIVLEQDLKQVVPLLTEVKQKLE